MITNPHEHLQSRIDALEIKMAFMTKRIEEIVRLLEKLTELVARGNATTH